MKFDKDIAICRRMMTILGVLMILGFVINLIARNWLNAGSFTVWAWACFTTVKTAKTHQKSRDETRSAMADMMRTWANSGLPKEGPPVWNIEGSPLGEAFQKHLDVTQKSHLQPHPIVLPPPTDAEVDAMDKAYGYKSYKCPKCGKVSHHPEDLKHRYCAACHEFERSDWRG